MSDTDIDSSGRPDCVQDVIEHANGAEECRELGMSCRAEWHEGELIPCEEVYGDEHDCPPERQLWEPAVTWSLPPIHR